MSIVANTYAHVIGIDTHARTHTLAVIDTSTSAVTDAATFPTSNSGRQRLLAWILRRITTASGTLVVIEGIGSYGATITRTVAETGLRVVEPFPTPKGMRAGRGKSDPIDAELIARSVTGHDAQELREARDDQGQRAAIRVLVSARELLNTQLRTDMNALLALLRISDLIDARGPLTDTQIATIAAWRNTSGTSANDITKNEARRLARAIRDTTAALKTNQRTMTAVLAASPAAILLDQPGIGPVTAAVIYAAWSHQGRIRSEAAFASLAGVSPIPASSGNTRRHRLNRGGDRRLNSALHTITLTRIRMDPATRQYVERRRAEGLTLKEIRRCLKRYIARHLYRLLNQPLTA